MIALADYHHLDLYRGLQYLFEKRLGIELYRPLGSDWHSRGYFHHPITEEALGILTEQCPFDPAKHKTVFDTPQDGVLYKNMHPKGVLFRWLPLDRVREIDYLICTSDRNESNFWKLKQDFNLPCKVLRYTGNGGERVDINKFDIFIPALMEHYQQYVQSGIKPGILYSPEFSLEHYTKTPLPDRSTLFCRIFCNFVYHHIETGTPYEQWCRYCGYCDEIGAMHIMHGLGTPPPGIEVPLDKIIDESFRAMGREDLLDRSKWPDLRFNRGEPANHQVISDLIKLSHMVCHPKGTVEGYGFLIRYAAAVGRPLIVPQWYKNLSASRWLQDKETCIYITGDDPLDKANFKWAMLEENNQRMSETINKRFWETTDFAAEAEAIRKLL